MTRRRHWGWTLVLCAGAACGDSLSIEPAAPTPLDTVHLRYSHVGCTNADSMRLGQVSNRITVQVDRSFVPDCGTVIGYYEQFTLGRLPSGDYDAELVVNPPPGALGPSVLAGSVHFSVAPMPPTGSLHPHENYTDMWWSPQAPGWAVDLYQSGDTLIGLWAVYGADGSPTWYAMLSGKWQRSANGPLHYAGTVYRTNGPYWATAYASAPVTLAIVGTADFTPDGSGATWSYTIEGTSGSKSIERMRF